MMLRGGRDNDIGEAWRLALCAGAVRQTTGKPCNRRIEGKNAVTIEME